MVLQTAAFVLWDGDKTVTIICNPEWNEDTRRKFFECLVTFQLSYHDRKESEEICNALQPIAKE